MPLELRGARQQELLWNGFVRDDGKRAVAARGPHRSRQSAKRLHGFLPCVGVAAFAGVAGHADDGTIIQHDGEAAAKRATNT